MTTFGFFDIADQGGGDFLSVRARTKHDLQELGRRHLPELKEITEGADPDYRYNAVAPREAVARAISEVVMSIDYHCFKDSVLMVQGFRRATLYGRIWNMLWSLQEEEQWYIT